MLFANLLAYAGPADAPSLLTTVPFCLLLLCIAILPLFHGTHHWWEKNRNKLLISVILGGITLLYYYFRQTGFHEAAIGLPSVLAVLDHSLIDDYLPFIVMLFSLYTISGGIRWEIRMHARPAVNTMILLVGTLLASLIGTTGASMLLIRPLLEVNQYRKHKIHTVLFFIFLVANIGGSLLPLGDPPLFIGYLRGVPFLWTLVLTPHWAWCAGFLLGIYFIWDSIVYRYESMPTFHPALLMDGTLGKRLIVDGRLNYLWLLLVVLCLAFLVPGKPFFNTEWIVPKYLRIVLILLITWLSWITTNRSIRHRNEFNFTAIGEVAFLFIGIFICMMPPLEILQARGSELGLTQPWHFFWATGLLSSFLDNAPTYAIFFEAAKALEPGATRPADSLLIPISIGAVFMGAMTYIGNGPNFMVKSIAENAGLKMPSFFGYLVYSTLILIPIFIALTWVFLI
jgi:Na+/H+ antiporter NhaD/arsenite permease-like protein